ncbi:hypothetical protein HY450_01765 [Candidatus Pacearchaeota archaeon]|nr:hypothetical protein [Candidatus Pacearchaeota archaeon]
MIEQKVATGNLSRDGIVRTIVAGEYRPHYAHDGASFFDDEIHVGFLPIDSTEVVILYGEIVDESPRIDRETVILKEGFYRFCLDKNIPVTERYCGNRDDLNRFIEVFSRILENNKLEGIR